VLGGQQLDDQRALAMPPRGQHKAGVAPIHRLLRILHRRRVSFETAASQPLRMTDVLDGIKKTVILRSAHQARLEGRIAANPTFTH
jgi:hypothetical protein